MRDLKFIIHRTWLIQAQRGKSHTVDYRRIKENERNELMLVRTNRTYTVLFVLFNKANLYLIAKGFEI